MPQLNVTVGHAGIHSVWQAVNVASVVVVGQLGSWQGITLVSALKHWMGTQALVSNGLQVGACVVVVPVQHCAAVVSALAAFTLPAAPVMIGSAELREGILRMG